MQLQVYAKAEGARVAQGREVSVARSSIELLGVRGRTRGRRVSGDVRWKSHLRNSLFVHWLTDTLSLCTVSRLGLQGCQMDEVILSREKCKCPGHLPSETNSRRRSSPSPPRVRGPMHVSQTASASAVLAVTPIAFFRAREPSIIPYPSLTPVGRVSPSLACRRC